MIRRDHSRGSMTIELDLVEMFGREVPPDLALSIGQAAIDTIINRTQGENRSVRGSSFRGYSDSYIESQAFKDFGKSPGDVNLTLTGDMLFDVDLLAVTPSSAVIGFRDATQREKAYNHHVGDTVPARPFFDLNNREIAEIIDNFSPMLEGEEESQINLFQTTFTPDPRTTALLDILADLGEFDD